MLQFKLLSPDTTLFLFQELFRIQDIFLILVLNWIRTKSEKRKEVYCKSLND